MNKLSIFSLLLILSNSVFSQVTVKPIGCFAGTNGTNPAVLSHVEARGVLVTEKWADIEQSPGVYDFSALTAKINTVKAAGLKYSLAVPAGAFGSPNWLVDSLNVSYHSFQYQNQNWRLPLWWDATCDQKLSELIAELGNQYASDSMLSHVYVSQMTVNGVEGHLNGVNMAAFVADGYTDQQWITSAKSTTHLFADAFPDKPIVFEVHEIDSDTIVPATIINDLTNDSTLCNRIGLGMWWISGKTSYQTDLVDFIYNYPGDKYAQVIGRSDQPERFQDSLYSTVFTQAKQLNIRYIEPWPFEFQHHTHDSLLEDFNLWADTNFTSSDTCSFTLAVADETPIAHELTIYPNPTTDFLNVEIGFPYKTIEIALYTLSGQKVFTAHNQTSLDISQLPKGMFFVEIIIDNKNIDKKLIIE